MWTAVKLLGAVCACYVAIAVWVYASQRRLLYHPSHADAGTPADMGLVYEDVHMQTTLGTDIHGWWIPCANARFTVLFSHGNAGNITHRVPSVRIFHDLGLSVLVYDYSGYGKSHGEPSEEATQADARAAWEWLTQTQNIAPNTIILFGRSLGGAVTARLAADLEEDGISPAGVIMESTFTSVPDMGATMYPWLPVRQLAKYDYDSIAALTPLGLPILFAHSEEDETVPYSIGRALYESYTGPKEFLLLHGPHNSGYIDMGKAYPDGLARFLRTLEHTP